MAPDATEEVRRYHALSTHRPGRFAPGPGHLDWPNQPEPFRTYAGAATVDLPLAGERGPAWADVLRRGALVPRPADAGSLGALLELTLGVTAWKQHGPSRWALRANPSSGNLHPTEGYLVTPSLPGLPAGVHHYLARDHVLERRLTPSPAGEDALGRLLGPGAVLVGLSSVHWREAWKYGERAYRYCQLDVGHALAGLRHAAATQGWAARLLEAPGDGDVAALLGLDREADQAGLDPRDREHPDLLAVVAPPDDLGAVASRVEAGLDALVALARDGTWAGRPNALSPRHADWPGIEAVAGACRKPRTEPAADASGAGTPAPAVASAGEAGVVDAYRLLRRRRSAQAMDGDASLPAAAFAALLRRLLPGPGAVPGDVLPGPPRVHPVLFVHRVDGLEPGLYLLDRGGAAAGALRSALRPDFLWRRPEAGPGDLPLFLLEPADARAFAREVSCRQEIAAASVFSLGLVADLETLGRGAWWYRRLLWEAGAVGQALYLGAEVAGLRGTGIGCFLDDVVHEVLGLGGDRFRDLYHFTVGAGLDDARLTTLEAYPDEVRSRPGREREPAARR